MDHKNHPLTEAEQKGLYRKYIKKFADEIEDLTKLQRVYTYAQHKWAYDGVQTQRKVGEYAKG